METDTERQQPTEGWAKPMAGARSFHYFREGTALCRRWMLFDRGQYQPDDQGAKLGAEPGREDCRPCWRTRRAELPEQVPNEGESS